MKPVWIAVWTFTAPSTTNPKERTFWSTFFRNNPCRSKPLIFSTKMSKNKWKISSKPKENLKTSWTSSKKKRKNVSSKSARRSYTINDKKTKLYYKENNARSNFANSPKKSINWKNKNKKLSKMNCSRTSVSPWLTIWRPTWCLLWKKVSRNWYKSTLRILSTT